MTDNNLFLMEIEHLCNFSSLYRRIQIVFTALHEMQTRSSEENSVRLSDRLSVRLSVCHTREL